MARVDIIASVFNADEFLEGYFNDLVGQTFFKESRLILVAPNPSQKLINLSKSVGEIYGNVDLIKLEIDRGVSNCLNIALKSSSSEYVTIANTDDRKRPDSLFRHFIELESNPEIDLVYAPSLVSTIPNETFYVNSCKSIHPCLEFEGLQGLLKNNSPHNNPMWRRSIHKKNGYLDESLISAADGELWMRCVLNGSKFKMIKDILGMYYLNPKGMSTNQDHIQERVEEVLAVRRKYANLLNEQNRAL